MAELFADLPEALDGAVELVAAARLHARGSRLPVSRLPAAARRDAGLVPAADRVERRAHALPSADRAGAGADRERARDDREARSGRLLPDRLGHRALLPRAEDPRAGPRLRRQQRRLLRAVDHGGRSGEDGAALRALSLGGARRVAGHRSRSALRRPAREGHPARLREVRPARRRHDGQRHHLPRPLVGARGRQGARLLARAGGPALEAPRGLELRRDPRADRGARPGDRRGGPRSRGRPHAPLPAPLPRRSRTCRGTSGSTRAAWSSRPAASTRSCRSSRRRCRAASSCSGTRTTAPISASSRWTCSASACSRRSRRRFR